jgi:hypothetical protein
MIKAHIGTRDSGKNLPSTQVYSTRQELLTALKEPNQTINVHNLENLDDGLHPMEQGAFVLKIKDSIHPTTNLTFTTNSPYILGELTPEEVSVFFKGKSKLLSEHPDIDRGINMLDMGEFWDAEGEDWVNL